MLKALIEEERLNRKKYLQRFIQKRIREINNTIDDLTQERRRISR